MKGNEREAKWKRDVLRMIKICQYDHGIFFSILMDSKLAFEKF